MALAIHMQRLIDEGTVRDYAELAQLGHVSRARITQIMNLILLAPDIQEEILFLPRVQSGRDPVREHAVREIAALVDWRRQRARWTRTAALAKPAPPDAGATRPLSGASTHRRSRTARR